VSVPRRIIEEGGGVPIMSGKDPEIDVTQAEARARPIQPRPQAPCYVVGQVGSPAQQRPIFVHLDAIANIVDALPGRQRREIAGLLVGGEREDEAGSYLVISGAIPAPQARGTSVSVTFAHETWNQLAAEKESRYPQEAIAGWYHTHPGLGVFLSDHDLFIHCNFFADTTHMALVIDPDNFSWAIFYWQDAELIAAPGCYIYGEPAGKYERLSELLLCYQAGRIQ